jgi:HlyD family secretion protein
MKKILIIAPILIIVIVAIYFVVSKKGNTTAKFVTAAVQRGDIAINVTATGTLQALTTVLVGSQVSGTILNLYVDFNDKVKKGQILAQLDPILLKAQVAQAEADMDKSKATALLTQRDYERAQSLFKGNLIAQSDKDIDEANYVQAQASVKSSKANLDRLKSNLDYATISSPIDGVVISRDVDVGQTVAASLQAPTLFTIAQDLTKMEVKTSVDEADIGKIKEGQQAPFTVDAYPDQIFNATVKQIRLSPEIVQNVVSYDVILAVSNPDLLLKPGMTANVTIQIDHRDDVLKVPALALRFRPVIDRKNATGQQGGNSRQDGSAYAARRANSSDSTGTMRPDSAMVRRFNQPKLWVLNEQKKPHPVPVQAGLSDGSFTEIITDALHEGDSVIVSQEGVQASTSSSQQVNPFMPRFGGAGGRR